MSQVLLNLIATYSLMYGVDPILATAVVAHESKFNASAVGAVGEIGLMQLRPEYFAKSCKGKSQEKCGNELFNPQTNIEIGIKHLADLQKRCKYKKDKLFIVCHNVGVVGGSRLQKPREFDYYKKVMTEYDRLAKLDLFKIDKRTKQAHGTLVAIGY